MIKIKEIVDPNSSFDNLLVKLRSKLDANISFDDITHEVEEVRKKNNDK